MKVESIYRPELFTIGADEAIADAASSMQYNEVGALPVFDEERFVGIVTERDIVRAAADDVDLHETPVREYMTAEPVVITPETSTREAADRMLTIGVRHLPVLVGEQVVGMVSVRDLLTEVAL